MTLCCLCQKSEKRREVKADEKVTSLLCSDCCQILISRAVAEVPWNGREEFKAIIEKKTSDERPALVIRKRRRRKKAIKENKKPSLILRERRN